MAAHAETLPGIERARSTLGLTLKQVAQAVHADESTLHRWRAGTQPTPVFLARLEALDELAREIQATFRDEDAARAWLVRPLPVLRDRRPLDLVLEGRAETSTGMLYALNSGTSL